MKNVTVVYVCFVIISVATLAATARRGRQSSHYLGSSVSSTRLSFVKTFDAHIYYLNDGCGNCGIVNKAVSPQPGQMSLKALNPENAELHPETLSHVESTISKEREEELRRLGIIEGNSNTWRNWHIMTQGQWPDIGQQKQPPSDPDAPITELYALRKPLEYWGFMRGIDDNISSYPIMWEYYKDTYGKVDVAEHGGSNPLYSPMLYRPSWDIEKDRGGLGYNDARLFRGWVGLDLDLPTKVKTASDLIMIPDTGRLYQKFYMGPYPITMGWTLGSLLKVLALSRSPGHGVVAVKVHNMNEDTTIDGVADDLMNIALNLNEVALETLEPGGEARVRTVIKGPAQVCAGSIEWPSFVKIATPDAYITNVEEGGTLDIELKIEWGRGLWLADYKGLYRHEDAADAVCMRRRRIKEVDEEDFHPITTFFGGCRMVRLAVHKLIGERWDLITSSCPDPREQLVVEVWTDRSTTPKAALEFGLSESIAWIRELKRQLIQDADFDGEDEQLRDTWEKIDKYKSLQQRQQMMGGPPTYNLHDTNAIPGLKESDCQYVGSVDDVKLVPQAPYSLPQIPPPRPQQDSLEWLATELQSEDYDDASPINSRSFEKFLPQPKDRATDVDLSILPVSQEVISSLRLCGFNTVHDIIQITENKLEDYPGITSKDAKIILDFIDSNILMKTG